MSNSTRKKNVSWNFEAATAFKVLLISQFLFSLSILLSRFKQFKLYFPVYTISTFACVICSSRPPKSERDITDTQSHYANRKSYITMNCRRAFQIWRTIDIDKKESLTNVDIIPLPVLRYFILCPSVFGIRSFLLVSVSLFRLNSSRRETVTLVLVFVWCSRW